MTNAASIQASEAQGGIAEQIAVVREFNRFYTTRLGLLRRRHLNGEFSLTEARLLYEIGSHPDRTASSLRSLLELDAGYVSRLLTLLSKRRLIRQTVSASDGREKLLCLTAAGRRTFAQLNAGSAHQIHELLAPLNTEERAIFVQALGMARSLLSRAAQSALRVVRLRTLTPEASELLQEYYDAVNVVVRDTPGQVRKLIRARHGGLWLAYLGEAPVGCVVLRELQARTAAGECKRLYVRPSARGTGVASALMDALEQCAKAEGLRSIYLDTHDGLKAAINLYRKRGYQECDRYNDNPQATVFLRKQLRRSKHE